MDGANGVVGEVRDAGWVSPEALQRDLQGMVDGLAEQIMGAVNGARKGQLRIRHETSSDFRRRTDF